MITSLDQVSEFPLCWPESKPRAARRRDPNTAERTWRATLANAHQKIEIEMSRIGARGFVVSMSPRHKFGSLDPGVAVWWTHKPKNPGGKFELRVLACDQYTTAEYNMHAIGLSLDRLRALERYGAYTMEQAIEGARPSLPPPASMSQKPWRTVLGDVPPGISKIDALAIVNNRYRSFSRDANGDEAKMIDLNLAIEAARKELAP